MQHNQAFRASLAKVFVNILTGIQSRALLALLCFFTLASVTFSFILCGDSTTGTKYGKQKRICFTLEKNDAFQLDFIHWNVTSGFINQTGQIQLKEKGICFDRHVSSMSLISKCPTWFHSLKCKKLYWPHQSHRIQSKKEGQVLIRMYHHITVDQHCCSD